MEIGFGLRRSTFGEGDFQISWAPSRQAAGLFLVFFFILVIAPLLLENSFGAESTNLIFNGNFEASSTQNPPPGWEMWGSKDNLPANFSRDGANPHGGKVSLRIHHPAGSSGYVISAPAYAIRAKKGKIYSLSFWARSDKIGPALSGFVAYEKRNPYIEAPAPTFPIEVGPNWKHYAFEIKESFDFSADRSRYLMLVFKAATTPEEEKTLWIDDVVVTEQDNPRATGLIDEKKISYQPLQHRLNPGTTLELSIDANKYLHRTNRLISGISFHRLTGYTGEPFNRYGQYTLQPETEQAIRDLHLPMTRFYGLGNEPFGLIGAIDRAAEVSKRVGIPQNRIVLECEPYKASTKTSPESWARAVGHSVQKGYEFQYWEIANEPEVASRQSGQRGAFSTSDEYIEHLKAVSKAVRSVQPQAKIGVAISDSPSWGNYILNRAAGYYDFIVNHYYGFIDAYQRRFEIVTLTENFKILDKILRINALIRAYNPGRDAYQLDTEWGLSSYGPNKESSELADRNGNIVGTLHRAVRLIYYAREDVLRGASSWHMLSHANEPGFGILTQEAIDKRFLMYWLYYYFNRYMGEWVVDSSGTAPYYYPTPYDDRSIKSGEFSGPITPVLVTQSKDKHTLYLIIANGSWDRSVPCRAKLSNFRAARTEGILLSHSDPNGNPLLQRKEEAVTPLSVSLSNQEVLCTIPPHSVVFISIQEK